MSLTKNEELALKVIARKATEVERNEFNTISENTKNSVLTTLLQENFVRQSIIMEESVLHENKLMLASKGENYLMEKFHIIV